MASAVVFRSPTASYTSAYGLLSPYRLEVCSFCLGPTGEVDLSIYGPVPARIQRGTELVFYIDVRTPTGVRRYLSTDPAHARIDYVGWDTWRIYWEDLGDNVIDLITVVKPAASGALVRACGGGTLTTGVTSVQQHYGQVTEVEVFNKNVLGLFVTFDPDVGKTQKRWVPPFGSQTFKYDAVFAEQPYLHSFTLDTFPADSVLAFYNVYSNHCPSPPAPAV